MSIEEAESHFGGVVIFNTHLFIKQFFLNHLNEIHSGLWHILDTRIIHIKLFNWYNTGRQSIPIHDVNTFKNLFHNN